METIVPGEYGLQVIINGGKETMDQATISVQWIISPKMVANVGHILIIDHDEYNINSDSEWLQTDRGTRHLFKTTDRIAFIPVQSPGVHRFSIIAVSKETSKPEILMKRESRYS